MLMNFQVILFKYKKKINKFKLKNRYREEIDQVIWPKNEITYKYSLRRIIKTLSTSAKITIGYLQLF